MEETRSAETPLSAPVERVFAGAFAGGMTVGAGLVYAFDPARSSYFPPCPLLVLTGIACPGCGMTRGFHALLHGDLAAVVDYNLLIPFVALFFAYLWVSLVLTAWRGRGLSFSLFPPWSAYTFAVVAVAFMVLRNIPVYPLTFLYP